MPSWNEKAHSTRALIGTSAEGERLLAFVRVTSSCWEWTAYRNSKGYGMCYFRGRRNMLAHRAFFIMAGWAIQDGLVLDHLCRNRACVRPDHLEAVSQRTNLLRGTTLTAKHAATTHCPKGHEYTPENTAMRGSSRRCRICEREYMRKHRARLATRSST